MCCGSDAYTNLSNSVMIPFNTGPRAYIRLGNDGGLERTDSEKGTRGRGGGISRTTVASGRRCQDYRVAGRAEQDSSPSAKAC